MTKKLDSPASSATLDQWYERYRGRAISAGDHESLAVVDRAQYGVVLYETLRNLSVDARSRMMGLGQREAQKIMRDAFSRRGIDESADVDVDVSDLSGPGLGSTAAD